MCGGGHPRGDTERNADQKTGRDRHAADEVVQGISNQDQISQRLLLFILGVTGMTVVPSEKLFQGKEARKSSEQPKKVQCDFIVHRGDGFG